ncbi:SprT-like domain-containing protein [Crocinitomicaceae bacterium]|nr:SprT-like domain-containing protein [Crocinitomicaceae bacterium]MDC0098724.1 SprT-like domain-containing protein [Crocinitomicaceae bacterium]MDC1196099.1 SprT-like domain-containing protein [Crocinitomicaceae bacterium]MDC1282597.1 SprT-like domain-containing protein [Crocinitomicaceae bacterium]
MSKKKEKYRMVLSKYLPANFIEIVVELLVKHPVKFRVAKPRKTKLGDFRANRDGLHQITVNGDLNPYSFLITTIHEFAHLVTFQEYKGRVKPHGKEWQLTYSKMIYPVIESGDLPKDVSDVLLNSLINVKASSCTDQNLSRVLIKYDKPIQGLILLEELPSKSVFNLSGKNFTKGNLRRTRYVCVDNSNNKRYLISALAQVKKIE